MKGLWIGPRQAPRSDAEAIVQHALFYLCAWSYFQDHSGVASERKLIRFGQGDIDAIWLLGEARMAIYEENITGRGQINDRTD